MKPIPDIWDHPEANEFLGPEHLQCFSRKSLELLAKQYLKRSGITLPEGAYFVWDDDGLVVVKPSASA